MPLLPWRIWAVHTAAVCSFRGKSAPIEGATNSSLGTMGRTWELPGDCRSAESPPQAPEFHR